MQEGVFLYFRVISSFFALTLLNDGLQLAQKNKVSLGFHVVSRYGDRSFSVCAPTLWNGLPDNLRLAVDLDTFKRDLKTYLFRKCFYSSC